jgi:hypothetical protein
VQWVAFRFFIPVARLEGCGRQSNASGISKEEMPVAVVLCS